MLVLPNVTKQYQHGADKTAEIKHFLVENKAVYSKGLIGDLSHIHYRAHSLSGIKIHDVSHSNNNNYLLDFSFDWTAHVGCGHDVHEETEHQSVSFKVKDTGEIWFNLLDIHERTTFEEF